MLRRGFLGVLGVAAAWPLAAHAQGGTPVIGYLSSGSAQGFTTRLAAFRRGLREIGYREGQNVAIEYRWAEGRRATADDGCRTGAAWRAMFWPRPEASVRLWRPRRQRRAIPIVFETGANPVNIGLVESISRPTGNITGVSSLNVEVGPKRFDLLRQLRPTATVVAVLVNPSNPNSKAVLEEARQASQALNLQR